MRLSIVLAGLVACAALTAGEASAQQGQKAPPGNKGQQAGPQFGPKPNGGNGAGGVQSGQSQGGPSQQLNNLNRYAVACQMMNGQGGMGGGNGCMTTGGMKGNSMGGMGCGPGMMGGGQGGAQGGIPGANKGTKAVK